MLVRYLVRTDVVAKYLIWSPGYATDIVFNLITGAIFQSGGFDEYTQTSRVPSLDDTHEIVAPYARHFRVTLQDSESDPLRQFWEMCSIAGVEPLPIFHTPVSSGWLECYNSQRATGKQLTRRLEEIRKWLTGLDWNTAFQVELLLHNGLLTTTELWPKLRSRIDNLRSEHGSGASEILRQFSVTLLMATTDPQTKATPEALLESVCRRMKEEKVKIRKMQLPDVNFLCHHITITPTGMLLEGPYPTQSNRVIRGYQEYDATLAENFVRVDFRDEDR